MRWLLRHNELKIFHGLAGDDAAALRIAPLHPALAHGARVVRIAEQQQLGQAQGASALRPVGCEPNHAQGRKQRIVACRKRGLESAVRALVARAPRRRNRRDFIRPPRLGRVFADLPQPNDGTVCLDETELPGASARAIHDVSHTGMLVSAPAAAAVARFLETGHF